MSPGESWGWPLLAQRLWVRLPGRPILGVDFSKNGEAAERFGKPRAVDRRFPYLQPNRPGLQRSKVYPRPANTVAFVITVTNAWVAAWRIC